MPENDAIVYPIPGKRPPKLGPIGIISSSRLDLKMICRHFGFTENHGQDYLVGRLYVDEASGISVAGPAVGSPYAVLLMETLIAWGVEKIIFLGWCGGIAENIDIGDIVIPTAAVIDEGTSKHYVPETDIPSTPSPAFLEKTKALFIEEGASFHAGPIWTTDAVFRETPEKVLAYQKKGILAVEMEVSALFTVSKFRGVEIVGVLAVSDTVSTLAWKTGFKDPRFKENRKIIVETLYKLCQKT